MENTETPRFFYFLVQPKMAEFSPVLPIRDHGGGGLFAQPIFPRSRSGSESESELSQSLARTKIRSYGSTASVSVSLGEKFVEHRVSDGDTLQGIALKYGVTVRTRNLHLVVPLLSDTPGFHFCLLSLHKVLLQLFVFVPPRSSLLFHRVWKCFLAAEQHQQQHQQPFLLLNHSRLFETLILFSPPAAAQAATLEDDRGESRS